MPDAVLRVGLETSITRFINTGLAVYTRNLARALNDVPGVEVVPLAVPRLFARVRRPAPRKVLAAYWQLVHARLLPLRLKQLGCDLIHYTVPMPVSSRLPCPAVATVHDIIPFVHPEWVPALRGERMRSGYRSVVARCRHLIANSEATRQDVSRHLGAGLDRITTVHLGGDKQLPNVETAEAEQLIAGLGLRPGYVLCVGSLEPRKNLLRVVEAYSGLHAPRPALVIAGGATFGQGQLHQLVQQQQLEQDVRFTGHIPSLTLAALYRCAAVFVYPSLYEGFGLPPLEAMQLGCPVITSNVSSLPEVVGDAALQIDPLDTGAIADAMEQLLVDTRLARQLRTRGVERVGRFTWDHCARATVDVYRQVAGT